MAHTIETRATDEPLWIAMLESDWRPIHDHLADLVNDPDRDEFDPEDLAAYERLHHILHKRLGVDD